VLPPGITLQQWQNDQNAMNFAIQALWQQQQQQHLMAQNPHFMMQQPGMMVPQPFNHLAYQMMQQHQFRLQQQQHQQQQQLQFNNQQRRFPQGNGYVFRGGAVRGGRGGGGGGGGGGQWYSNNSGHSSAASSAAFSAGSPSRQSLRFSKRHPSRDHPADDSISGLSVEAVEEEGTTGVGSQQPLSKPQEEEEEVQEEAKEEQLPKDGDIMIFNRNVYLMTVGDQGSGFYLQGQAIPEFAEHAGILKVDDATRETILMTAKNSKSL
jgi:hypothetical protein